MSKEPQFYRLKLKSLAYVSSVDAPAQETATARLLKRKSGSQIEATARVVKLSDELGLVFGWALTTKAAGVDYFDLHGDNIVEDDLIRIAAEWMEGGGAADTMHDRDQDGRAVFAMPMTTEVAKAVYGDEIGGKLGTYGLLVAIKPSSEDFAKFKSGELTGFSIDGTGIREAVKTRKSVDKRYLTDEVAGHQHEVCSYPDGGGAWCADATSEGAQSSHRHNIMRDEDGKLVVLADSGHTHTLTEWPRVIVAPEGTTVVPEAVAARATPESPRAHVAAKVDSKMNELDQLKAQLAALTGEVTSLKEQLAAATAAKADAETRAELTDEEKAHAKSLSTPEAKRFLALEKSARVAEVQKAKDADPVVVTFKGVDYRGSMGAHVVELAKAAKAQAEQIEKAEIEKQATAHLGNLAGDKDVHAAIVKAVYATTATDLDLRGKMLAVLDGANAIAKGRSVPAGGDGARDGSTESEDAYEALSKGLTTFCKANQIDKVWTVGFQKFVATPEGAALKRAHDAARAAR